MTCVCLSYDNVLYSVSSSQQLDNCHYNHCNNYSDGYSLYGTDNSTTTTFITSLELQVNLSYLLLLGFLTGTQLSWEGEWKRRILKESILTSGIFDLVIYEVCELAAFDTNSNKEGDNVSLLLHRFVADWLISPFRGKCENSRGIARTEYNYMYT